jgi:hypothetical protein
MFSKLELCICTISRVYRRFTLFTFITLQTVNHLLHRIWLLSHSLDPDQPAHPWSDSTYVPMYLDLHCSPSDSLNYCSQEASCAEQAARKCWLITTPAYNYHLYEYMEYWVTYCCLSQHVAWKKILLNLLVTASARKLNHLYSMIWIVTLYVDIFTC